MLLASQPVTVYSATSAQQQNEQQHTASSSSYTLHRSLTYNSPSTMQSPTATTRTATAAPVSHTSCNSHSAVLAPTLRAHESSYHLPSPQIPLFGLPSLSVSSSYNPLRQLSEQLNLTSSPNTHPKNYQQPIAQQLSHFGSPQYSYIPIPFNLTNSQDYSYYTPPQQQDRYHSAAQHITQYQLSQPPQQHLLPHHHTVLHHLSSAHFAHQNSNSNAGIGQTSVSASCTQSHEQSTTQSYTQQQEQQQSSLPVVTTFSQSDAADESDASIDGDAVVKKQRSLSDRVVVKLSKSLMSTYNQINEKYNAQKKSRQQQQHPDSDATKQQQQQLHQTHSLSQLHASSSMVESSTTVTQTSTHTHTTHHTTHQLTINQTLYNNGYDGE